MRQGLRFALLTMRLGVAAFGMQCGQAVALDRDT